MMPGNILEMSDEDFLNLGAPPVAEQQGSEKTDEERAAEEAAAAQAQSGADAEAAAEAAKKQEQEAADAEAAQATADAAAAAASSKETSGGGTVTTEEGEQVTNDKKSTEQSSPADQTGKAKPGAESKEQKESSTPGSKTEGQGDPPDYEALYKELLQPIKANGKMLDLKSPQEIRQLAQMGANYTRKMQELAPHRKVLMMLENNGLLDEGKLSFLIDIEKKNPEAIRKLIKDAGIDPLEIDTTAEPAYRVGNHRVSDEEAAFASAMDDVQNKDGGTETLKVIQSKWDQASKDVLWNNPELLDTIHDQRASGVYDRIADEVERQRALGTLQAKVPFLQAYKAIGDQMAEAGLLNDLVKQAQPKAQTVVTPPVVTRTAPAKPAVKNGDKVSAAAATRSTPKTAVVKVNPLSLSDEDFMKQVANRQ